MPMMMRKSGTGLLLVQKSAFDYPMAFLLMVRKIQRVTRAGLFSARSNFCFLAGPTGVGKTRIAGAIAHKACRLVFTAQYRRRSRLFDELSYANGDGRYP